MTFAASNFATAERLILVASALLGVAVFLLVSRLVLLVDRHVRTVAAEWEFEQKRRIRLRLANRVYRWTEPLIDELAGAGWLKCFPLEQIEVSLDRGGSALPWTPREFMATTLMETLLLFVGVVFFGTTQASLYPCIAAASVAGAVYLRACLRNLRLAADDRIQQICRRLPYGIELVALTMRAGSGLREALETVVSETPDHPFSEEFRRVLEEFNRGRTLQESLTDLDRRLRNTEVREMVFSILKSEELGTPLSEIFANLAEQMRLKKAQWAEAEAGRAQVRVQGPALVIMVACMLTILAPFIFQMLSDSATQ